MGEQSFAALNSTKLTRIRFGTARIILLMPLGGHAQYIPFDTRIIFAQINANLDFIVLVVLLVDVL